MENLQPNKPIKLEPKKVQSIKHALEVLNGAAKDSSSEIKHMIDKDYQRIKETLSYVKPEIKGALKEMGNASKESIGQAKDIVVETTKQAAEKVDESVHKHPWYFVAGSAAAAGLLGFALGKKISK